VTDELDPPAAVLDLVAPSVGGAALVPVARLLSDRARQRLVDGEGRLVAEVDDDRVTVFAPGSDREVGRFREIEVEFEADFDDAAVAGVVDRLLVAGARRSAGRSKVWRALDLLGRRP